MIITDQKILKNKSKDYDENKHILKQIIAVLEKELVESEIKGVGLSAIQINIPVKIGIVRTEKLSLNLYNAKIINASDGIIFQGEGCLSVPNTYTNTMRMNHITIKNGDGNIYNLEGFEAVVVQHELDHFNGILMIDRSI